MKTPRIWRLTSSSEGRSSMGACVRETRSVTLSHNALVVRRPPCIPESYPPFSVSDHTADCATPLFSGGRICHLADMTVHAPNVHFRGQSGHRKIRALEALMPAYDPKRTPAETLFLT